MWQRQLLKTKHKLLKKYIRNTSLKLTTNKIIIIKTWENSTPAWLGQSQAHKPAQTFAEENIRHRIHQATFDARYFNNDGESRVFRVAVQLFHIEKVDSTFWATNNAWWIRFLTMNTTPEQWIHNDITQQLLTHDNTERIYSLKNSLTHLKRGLFDVLNKEFAINLYKLKSCLSVKSKIMLRDNIKMKNWWIIA